MLYLYFVRHGETEWNREKRIQGRLDSNLTETGIRDAYLLSEKLKSVPFKEVISSPSKRTVHTASILKNHRSIPFRTDERLMEINLGPWQGKTIEEIEKEDPERYHCYRYQPSLYTCNKGENFHNVKERLLNFLEDIEKKHNEGNVLIVTHGMVLKTLQTICKHLSIDEIWAEPWIEGTSLTIVKTNNGKRELIVEGDVSHKKEIMH